MTEVTLKIILPINYNKYVDTFAKQQKALRKLESRLGVFHTYLNTSLIAYFCADFLSRREEKLFVHEMR